jgi:rRNA processing protein Gar1
MSERKTPWHPGDVIVVEGHHLADRRRVGEVLAVLGDPSHPHFSVRWDDGHETHYYPGPDAVVHRPA